MFLLSSSFFFCRTYFTGVENTDLYYAEFVAIDNGLMNYRPVPLFPVRFFVCYCFVTNDSHVTTTIPA